MPLSELEALRERVKLPAGHLADWPTFLQDFEALKQRLRSVEVERDSALEELRRPRSGVQRALDCEALPIFLYAKKWGHPSEGAEACLRPLLSSSPTAARGGQQTGLIEQVMALLF